MADSGNPGEPGELAGWHGEDWCVCPQFFGPPDQVDEFVMRWLIIPGPPMSCTLVYQFGSPVANADRYAYHLHPKTWSIHVCISGKGKHYANGNVSEVVPGTIFYEAPGAVHTVAPDPGHGLLQACIQYPVIGYEGETKVVPEAGRLDKFGDLEAFIQTFGPSGEKYKAATAGLFKSERWLKYVTNRNR
ncbi:MAG TPA: AraC family ligand binding domain-containing protein [Kofleriaceae bacterium]|nr:AraC family ligand binding domain-containing protein [Kofleriaceae bacterium]